jgi:hypothetical protein
MSAEGVHGSQGSCGAMASATMTARITPSTIKIHITAASDRGLNCSTVVRFATLMNL